jgi:bifunctional DNase/RNase
MVEVTIDAIRMSLMTQNRVVILKEKGQDRFLPIWIGNFEADAITFELQDISPKRPLTHDLLKSLISELGAEVKQIVVTELRRPDDIFFANIVLELNGETIEIDSRPSDAIALAVRVGVPIFVNEEVMDIAGVRPENDVETDIDAEDVGENDERLSVFKDFVETLDLDNLEDDDK